MWRRREEGPKTCPFTLATAENGEGNSLEPFYQRRRPRCPTLTLEALPYASTLGGWQSRTRWAMNIARRRGFYRQEVNKTLWELPRRYTSLHPVGSGAYGSVW